MNTLPLSKGDFFVSWQAPHYKNPIRYDCDFWVEEDNSDETPYPYVELEWPENANEKTKVTIWQQPLLSGNEFRREATSHGVRDNGSGRSQKDKSE